MGSQAAFALLLSALLISTAAACWAEPDTYSYAPNRDGTITRYRVDGAEWVRNRGQAWEEKIGSVAQDARAVYCFVNRTAFVSGFENGLWVCAVDSAGRILSRGFRLALTPTKQAAYAFDPALAKHPTLPLLVYGNGGASAPRTIWRVVAPGKVAKVGAFPPALTDSAFVSLCIEPGRHFFYEMTGGNANGGTGWVAVFTLDKTGTRAKLSVPPFPLPSDNSAGFIFVVPPAK